jgi:hypothetical protein
MRSQSVGFHARAKKRIPLLVGHHLERYTVVTQFGTVAKGHDFSRAEKVTK